MMLLIIGLLRQISASPRIHAADAVLIGQPIFVGGNMAHFQASAV
jgi:hypothetical protein